MQYSFHYLGGRLQYFGEKFFEYAYLAARWLWGGRQISLPGGDYRDIWRRFER